MAEHAQLASGSQHRSSLPIRTVPGKRGTYENGLLCQHLSKGTGVSGYTQRELNAIVHRLDTRLGKCLDYAPAPSFTLALGT